MHTGIFSAKPYSHKIMYSTVVISRLWQEKAYKNGIPLTWITFLEIIFHHQYELFPHEYSGRDVRLTTHLRMEPRLRMGGSTPPLPLTCLHGVLRKHLIYQFLCDLIGGRKNRCHEQHDHPFSFHNQIFVTERIILSFYIIGAI